MAVKQTLLSRAATVKPYLQYLVGVLLIINSIGLFTYSVESGILMLCAGLLVLPRIQTMVEQQVDVTLSPLVLIGIVGALFIGSSAFLFTAVDLSQAPDFLVPFGQ